MIVVNFIVLLYLQVFGVGVPNPYRIRPFVGAKMPVNSSFSPLIHMHNPHNSILQVSVLQVSFGNFLALRNRLAGFASKTIEATGQSKNSSVIFLILEVGKVLQAVKKPSKSFAVNDISNVIPA